MTLVSEARGTRMAPVFTGTTGDFVVLNVTPDTYAVDVTLEGFHPVRRAGIAVSGADRVNIGALTLTVGSASETVTVTAESPLIQTQSGERSFSISAEAVQAIAVNGRNYNNLINLAPGVVAGTVNGLRVNQNTLQIDGITSVDTGNNGNAVTLTVDAVQEVKPDRVWRRHVSGACPADSVDGPRPLLNELKQELSCKNAEERCWRRPARSPWFRL